MAEGNLFMLALTPLDVSSGMCTWIQEWCHPPGSIWISSWCSHSPSCLVQWLSPQYDTCHFSSKNLIGPFSTRSSIMVLGSFGTSIHLLTSHMRPPSNASIPHKTHPNLAASLPSTLNNHCAELQKIPQGLQWWLAATLHGVHTDLITTPKIPSKKINAQMKRPVE